MEEQDIQTNHHQTHQVEGKDSWIYIILGMIFLMPLVWTAFGSEIEARRHPYNSTEYSLNWYLTFLFVHSQGIFYLLVAKCIKPKYKALVNIAMIWPAWEIIDHVLFYSQSPVRHLFAVILMTYIAWYHNRHELKNHIISIVLLILFTIWYFIEYDHGLFFGTSVVYPRIMVILPIFYIMWYFLDRYKINIWEASYYR